MGLKWTHLNYQKFFFKKKKTKVFIIMHKQLPQQLFDFTEQ